MGHIIAVANQKGGVGKTTTSVNLACALAKFDKNILLIDLDPQGNASVSLGVDKDELKQTIFDALVSDVSIEDILLFSEQTQVSLLPANSDLTAAEVELLDEGLGTTRLRDILAPIQAKFDYILIDCPPTLNMLTINAMGAANGILVPVQCEYFALEGLSSLMGTIDTIKEALNPGLQIDGLLRTMHDRRNNLANDVSNELLKHFGMKVLQTIIPRNVRLAEAPSYGESILDYDKTSSGAMAYSALATELLRKIK